MKGNENKIINDLLIEEEKYRESGQHQDCFNTCRSILNEIKSYSNNLKFEIISKLFLYQNQSNYVRINLMHELFQDNNFINSLNLKRKYYQLLIDSFNNTKSNDLIKQKNNILKLYAKCSLDNFDDLDQYIVTSLSNLENDEKNENFQQYEEEKNIIDNLKDSLKKSVNKSISNTFLVSSLSSTEKRLESQDNLLPQSNMQTSVEEFNAIKQSEMNSSIQKINTSSENKNNQLKVLLKKYKPNAKLPLIIVSVSANLNRNQFLEIINNIFMKFNYRLVSNLKDTEFENLNVYEYKPTNCCENIKYLIRNKFVKNEFQVLTILKSDENNFTRGINTFLNDIYERKISIKSIRGNEKSIIQFFIHFLSAFCLSINKIKIIKQSKCLLKYNLEQMTNNIIQNEKNKLLKNMKLPQDICKDSQIINYQKLINDETYVEFMNSKANKYYELYKTLSKEGYELGKSIKTFVNNFKNKYLSLSMEQIQNLDTKEMMIEIVKIIELCSNTLNSSYNNKQGNDITYYSLATEQFIFNKIYYIIYDIYSKKYKTQNDQFLAIQKEINEKLSISELMQKIGVKKKFIGAEDVPYKSAIDTINMVHFEKSLKKKFEILTRSSLEIRTYILDNTQGKYELDSMDDELPIIIYISTRLKVNNLFAELNIVDDYIKIILRDDLIQNKMVTNLLSSIIYINKTWNSETLTFDKK